MQAPITLKSGAVLQVGIASFTEANRLLKAVALELAKVEFSIDNLDFSALGGRDINTLKNALLQVVASESIETALFVCMKRCLYDDVQITRDTFEPEKTRPDYIPVAWEVMKANLSPFFSGLRFGSSTAAGQTPGDQK